MLRAEGRGAGGGRGAHLPGSGALGARGGGGGRGPPGRQGGAGPGTRRDGAPAAGAARDWRSGEPGAPGGARRDPGQAARDSTPACRCNGPPETRACGECALTRESGTTLFAGFQATEKR